MAPSHEGRTSFYLLSQSPMLGSQPPLIESQPPMLEPLPLKPEPLLLTPTVTRASSFTAVGHLSLRKEDSVFYPELGTARSVAIILICLLGIVISNMTPLAVNVIFPVIQRDIDADLADLQWLSSGFSLGYGTTLLLAGQVSDLYGHKLCLLIGLFIFGAFSLGFSLAQSLHQLALFRALQGIGAAAISPSLLAILGRTFAPGTKMRAEAFATFSAGSPLGSAVGLFVGGFITQQTLHWRAFFYFSIGLSMTAALLAYFIIPPDPPREVEDKQKSVDWIGGGLVVSGLISLVAALAIKTHYSWKEAIIVTPFNISILLLSAFVVWEYQLEKEKSGNPLIKVSLFKKLDFSAVHCVSGLVYMAFTDQNYFLNQYFQSYLKLPLGQTLIRFLPLLGVGILVTLVTGRLADILPGQIMMIIGCSAASLSCLLTCLLKPSASYWTFNFFAISLSIVGADFVFTVGAMYALKHAEEKSQASLGALFLMFTQVTSALGLSIATIVQVEVTRAISQSNGIKVGAHVKHAPRGAYLQGLRAAFKTCLASVLLATVISVIFLRGMGYVGSKSVKFVPEEEEEEKKKKCCSSAFKSCELAV